MEGEKHLTINWEPGSTAAGLTCDCGFHYWVKLYEDSALEESNLVRTRCGRREDVEFDEGDDDDWGIIQAPKGGGTVSHFCSCGRRLVIDYVFPDQARESDLTHQETAPGKVLEFGRDYERLGRRFTSDNEKRAEALWTEDHVLEAIAIAPMVGCPSMLSLKPNPEVPITIWVRKESGKHVPAVMVLSPGEARELASRLIKDADLAERSHIAEHSKIRIRRLWNDHRIAEVRLGRIGGFHWGSSSRGVHEANAQPFIQAFVSCDAVEGDLAHSCREGSRPHSIKVCIVKKDNDKTAWARCLEAAGPKPTGLKAVRRRRPRVAKTRKRKA